MLSHNFCFQREKQVSPEKRALVHVPRFPAQQQIVTRCLTAFPFVQNAFNLDCDSGRLIPKRGGLS